MLCAIYAFAFNKVQPKKAKASGGQIKWFITKRVKCCFSSITAYLPFYYLPIWLLFPSKVSYFIPQEKKKTVFVSILIN